MVGSMHNIKSFLGNHYIYNQSANVNVTFDPTTSPILDSDEVSPVEGALVTWWQDLSKLEPNDEEHCPSTSCDLIATGNAENGETLMTEKREIGVLTDVCNSNDLPEVEIFSLIEEQIPKYRLRADTITDFCGYDNEDWIIQTPLIPIDEDIELTTEQIQETLKYFILCSERVTQMTRTYNDIEAVNRLLEEKERDLELAARIGQTLLTKNEELTTKNGQIEDQLIQTTEKFNQLKHEIQRKDELLQALTHNESESSSNDSTPCGNPEGLYTLGAGQLEKKVKNLEEENIRLRIETAQLSAETSEYEEKEAKLVTDCLQQLGDVKRDLEFYVEELSKKTDESNHQKEEITSLLAQVVDLQHKVKVLTLENLELNKHLEASQSSQKRLTTELKELKDKHDELYELLEENQEELRRLRRKQKPGVAKNAYLSSSLLSIPSDSLASELEGSWKSELDMQPGISPSERRVQNWKIFETAKAAKRASNKQNSGISNSSSLMGPGLSELSSLSLNVSHLDSGESSQQVSGRVSTRSSMYFSDNESDKQSDGYNADLDSLYGSTPKINKLNLGRPGIPGSNDLETALRKLSIRRANELNEQDYFEEEDKRKRNRSGTQVSEVDTPGACHTPDSTMSTGSVRSGFSQLSLTGSASGHSHYKLPEKLKIIKPLEGSVTLRQWQLLATPHLGGIFEARPGVQIKGERKLDLQEEMYNLSDFEEDDDFEDVSCGGRFQESSTVNTYTNSMVKHPTQLTSDEEDIQTDNNDSDSVTPRMSTPKTGPVITSSSKGTSTYSMSLGLAAILNERDLISPEQTGKSKVTGEAASNPRRITSIISDSHFDSFRVHTSDVTTTSSCACVMSSKTIRSPVGAKPVDLGLSSLPKSDIDSKQDTENTNAMKLPKLTSLSGADIQDDSILNKLKNTGYSWYGFLGKLGQRSDSVTSLPPDFNKLKMPNTLSETSEPTTAGGMMSSQAKSADDLVSVMTTSETATTKSGSISSLFGRKPTPSGVLGALTSFRQNGIL